MQIEFMPNPRGTCRERCCDFCSLKGCPVAPAPSEGVELFVDFKRHGDGDVSMLHYEHGFACGKRVNDAELRNALASLGRSAEG